MKEGAARHGWAGLAVWVMAPVIYALASDTLIGVIRAYVIARQLRLREAPAADETTPLQMVGAGMLWLLRLVCAPPTTLRGLHRWVKSLPAAPPDRLHSPGAPDQSAVQQVADRAEPAGLAVVAAEPADPRSLPRRCAAAHASLRGTKQERFLALVIARYGPLGDFDVSAVSRAAAELAPAAELHPGTARKILRARVLAAQNGDLR